MILVFANILQMKYFLCTIKHLVCRKVCSESFENRLTNNVIVKIIFE